MREEWPQPSIRFPTQFWSRRRQLDDTAFVGHGGLADIAAIFGRLEVPREFFKTSSGGAAGNRLAMAGGDHGCAQCGEMFNRILGRYPVGSGIGRRRGE